MEYGYKFSRRIHVGKPWLWTDRSHLCHPAKVPNSLSDNKNNHVFTVVGFKLALLFGEMVGTCVSINSLYTICLVISYLW